ncbi:MAG: TIGR04255 family protein, partial [Candidatus Binatia bacterium]
MPFPQGQREIYRRNTITEAVCQLRFPTILQVSAHSPVQYQNLVKADYPFYSEEKPQFVLPKEVQELAGGFPLSAGLHQTSLHKFHDPEHTCLITLNQDFLAVTETKYERWQYLRDRICRAEEAFRQVYQPVFYT